MQVNSATSSNNSATSPFAGDTGDMFLQLLTTQLKTQDPLSPMDPTQFVGQLVQFNTLSEIMKIRELLQSTDPTSSSGAATTSGKETAGVQGGN